MHHIQEDGDGEVCEVTEVTPPQQGAAAKGATKRHRNGKRSSRPAAPVKPESSDVDGEAEGDDDDDQWGWDEGNEAGMILCRSVDGRQASAMGRGRTYLIPMPR